MTLPHPLLCFADPTHHPHVQYPLVLHAYMVPTCSDRLSPNVPFRLPPYPHIHEAAARPVMAQLTTRRRPSHTPPPLPPSLLESAQNPHYVPAPTRMCANHTPTHHACYQPTHSITCPTRRTYSRASLPIHPIHPHAETKESKGGVTPPTPSMVAIDALSTTYLPAYPSLHLTGRHAEPRENAGRGGLGTTAAARRAGWLTCVLALEVVPRR